MTRLRKMMLEDLQARKSLRLCLAALSIRWFDPIAEPSEFPKHLASAELLRSFGDRWAPFFVTDSAAAVADAYLSGNPVVVCGTAGPGVTHFFNGLMDARKEGLRLSPSPAMSRPGSSTPPRSKI